jgi:predicted nuclease of predicted toxin-antitoxin system
MKSLLLDEMLSPAIAQQLREHGADVVAITAEPTMRGMADPDVLELATGQDRLLVTENVKDFAPLSTLWAAQGRTHPGIVFVSSKAFPHNRDRIGRLSAALVGRLDADRWPVPGQVEFF